MVFWVNTSIVVKIEYVLYESLQTYFI